MTKKYNRMFLKTSFFNITRFQNFLYVKIYSIFQIKYECVPGFELVGKDTRYCQSDGTWTPR